MYAFQEMLIKGTLNLSYTSFSTVLYTNYAWNRYTVVYVRGPSMHAQSRVYKYSKYIPTCILSLSQPIGPGGNDTI